MRRFARTAILLILAAVFVRPQIRRETAPTRIIVATSPDAEIFLDDARQGKAPSTGQWTITDPSPGPHVIRVESYKKRSFTQKVIVTAGQTTHVAAKLVNYTGDLEVFTVPEAAITLDGRAMGKTDANGRLLIRKLDVDTYHLRIEHSGYNAAEERVDLERDVVNSVTLPLVHIEAVETAATPPPSFVLHRVLSGPDDSIVGVFFQPDGRLVSWGHHLVQWDPESGRQLRNTLVDESHYLTVSPDLRWAAISHHYQDDTNTTSLVEIGPRPGAAERPEIRGFAQGFSPDSKYVAIVDRASEPRKGTVAFWNLDAMKPEKTWTDSTIRRVVFSPDGRWVATDRSNAALWDLSTNQKIRELPAQNPIDWLAFSPDARWLAVLTTDEIRLWEVATGRQGRTIEPPGPEKPGFHEAAFLPGGQYLVTSNNPGIYIIDTVTGRPVAALHQGGGEIAVSPDGRWIAAGQGSTITLWRRTK